MGNWDIKAVNKKVYGICDRSVEEILENYMWNLQ